MGFLLIACFGILFAGCSGVRGPNSQQALEDTTFTPDDVAAFQQTSSADSLMGTDPSTGTGSEDIALAPLETVTESGAAVQFPPVDPALLATYEAIRSVPEGSSVSFRVVNDTLNVRASASTTAPSVAVLRNGNAISLMEFVNAGWAKVRLPDGKEGFVSAKYIAKETTSERVAEEEKAYENLFYVNYAFVNVRKNADSKSEKIGEIPGQAFVRPIGMDADWARVSVDGKEGFVSRQFLSAFRPTFIVRQNTFRLPVLHYDVSQPDMVETLKKHVVALKQDGARLVTLRDFFDILLLQEQKQQNLQPKSVVVAISGATPETVRQVSQQLKSLGARATFFLQTRHVGITGISEKELLTLQANGFDIQSGGHTGDDLRTLTSAGLRLELSESRTLLEEMTNRTVFAVAYPLGGVNDRVLGRAKDSGYLFGLAGVPDTQFSRDQLLRMPSVSVTSSMTTDDVLQLVR